MMAQEEAPASNGDSDRSSGDGNKAALRTWRSLAAGPVAGIVSRFFVCELERFACVVQTQVLTMTERLAAPSPHHLGRRNRSQCLEIGQLNRDLAL